MGGPKPGLIDRRSVALSPDSFFLLTFVAPLACSLPLRYPSLSDFVTPPNPPPFPFLSLWTLLSPDAQISTYLPNAFSVSTAIVVRSEHNLAGFVSKSAWVTRDLPEASYATLQLQTQARLFGVIK